MRDYIVTYGKLLDERGGAKILLSSNRSPQ
jgi:hypothetical protein